MLEVRESSVPGAGLGVFVASDSVPIIKDTLLTYYGVGETVEESVKNSPGARYNVAVPGKTGWVRMAHPWDQPLPSRVEDGLLGHKVGHLINDATALPNTGLGLKRMWDNALAYANASGEGSNVVMGKDWGVRATKDITPGEELLMTYGPAYWLHHIAQHNDEPLLRLQTFLLLSQVMPTHFSQGALVFNKEGRIVRSTTNETPDEEYSRWLVRDYLGAKNTKVLVELGLDAETKTGYPLVLMHLLDAVISFDPEKDTLPDVEEKEEEEAAAEEPAVVLEERNETLTAEA